MRHDLETFQKRPKALEAKSGYGNDSEVCRGRHNSESLPYPYFASGPKMKVKTPFVLTGASLKIAGLKTHLRAASTAALRSARWPLMALASTTSPTTEMVTSTWTVPVAFNFLKFD